MLKYFLLMMAACIMTIQFGFAQLPPIQLDRPDQTECPFIVPEGYIQAENGFTYETVNDSVNTLVYPSTLWKYGLNKNAELRIITELNRKNDGKEMASGLIPITIGFKAKICEEKGIIPLTSFIGHLTSSHWGSKKFHADFFAPSFRFVMQHTLNSKASLSYNLGARWDGFTPRETYIYTLTTG
ncbi:MAG: transporter, partial [Ferruginibacter sp.]|nr:transporter [Ferruginibacter sp.]